MSNTFKAMIYRIVKSRILVYAILCNLAFPLALSLIGLFSENAIQGIYMTWDNWFLFGNLICMAFVCANNCSDYRNKTIHLEIMNGHSSTEIFAGRALALIVTSELMFHIGSVITHLMLRSKEEYVSIIENNGPYVLRIAAIELIFLAYALFYVFISFIVKRTSVALIASWLGYAIGGLAGLLDDRVSLPGIGKLSSIFGPNSVRALILDGFSVTQGITASVIPLCFMIAFVIIGIINLGKQEF